MSLLKILIEYFVFIAVCAAVARMMGVNDYTSIVAFAALLGSIQARVENCE